ncbi:hypothetical protein [Spirillospora sp. CA-128828]|uniref:hypothetical protein n=1 Tax=Spirillospora sp. CA-128828 TaxID=3240033 RepID=UPI003D8FB3C7
MPDIEALSAAGKPIVVETSAPIGSISMWALFHYECSKGTRRSIARGDLIQDWLRGLVASRRMIGFGWKQRGQVAPDDWHGWPVTNRDCTADLQPNVPSEVVQYVPAADPERLR